MYKNSVGELQLSPIKDEGKFVFMNHFVRVNGKVIQGDFIKIFVETYKHEDGVHRLSQNSLPSCSIKIRGEKTAFSMETTPDSVEALYDKAAEFYKNQFYFGKVTSQQ